MGPRKRPASKTTAAVSEETTRKSARISQLENSTASDSCCNPQQTVANMGLEWIPSHELIAEDIPFAYALVPSVSQSCQKIAAFDMDYCLICCKSGRKWPQGVFFLVIDPKSLSSFECYMHA